MPAPYNHTPKLTKTGTIQSSKAVIFKLCSMVLLVCQLMQYTLTLFLLCTGALLGVGGIAKNNVPVHIELAFKWEETNNKQINKAI